MSGWVQQGLWWEVYGKACYITLEPRPVYCDRGNWVAKISTRHDVPQEARLELGLDGQDGWPRYFMDESRAKAEIDAWLVKRRQNL